METEDKATDARLTKKIIDYSDKASFQFGFVCDQCEYEWKSERVPFHYAEIVQVLDDEARAMLWTEEHRNAYARAALDASLHFNQCPECGLWVCDACFFLLESGRATANFCEAPGQEERNELR